MSDSDFPYLCFWQARRYLLRTPPRFTGCVTSLLEKSHKKRIGNSLSCVCVCVCTLTKALTHFSESVHFIFISFSNSKNAKFRSRSCPRLPYGGVFGAWHSTGSSPQDLSAQPALHRVDLLKDIAFVDVEERRVVVAQTKSALVQVKRRFLGPPLQCFGPPPLLIPLTLKCSHFLTTNIIFHEGLSPIFINLLST